MAESEPPLPKDSKNYYHPCNEQEIVALVKYANENNLQVRVRGASHSMPQAIFTDKCTEDKVNVLSVAPDGNSINMLLDRYNEIILPVDKEKKLVTVQAGIHLGHDPIDPLSTKENNLLYRLHYEYGLTLCDLGGIAHQTVGGFLSTGSSGGSLRYGIHDNVWALRFVDGNGEIVEVCRDDPNPEEFWGSIVSLGVLGVLSQVTFKCSESFNISGYQKGTLCNEGEVDLFNENPLSPENKTGLIDFLKKKDYARILWWPQSSEYVDKGEDRMQVWQAERIPSAEGFEPHPYVEFPNTEIMMLYSYLMILIGNINSMATVREISKVNTPQFEKLTKKELMEKYHMSEEAAKLLTDVLLQVNIKILELITGITEAMPDEFRKELLPHFTTFTIKLLNLIDKSITFKDYAFLGLPMDSSADDILVPVMWTEIWVPLPRATQVTTILREYFRTRDPQDTFNHTGNNNWELYSAKPTKAWLSMSYTDGEDEWKEGAFRVDALWFIHNSGNFRDLYRPVWVLLKKKGIPYRLHWGKSFPLFHDEEISAKDLVADQYPKLARFLELRKARDPKGIFLNAYWRHWLGLPA
jgi:D-arabinono-1,4-lactone oxidase